MAQLGLSAAKSAKKDEFYTQMTDIERELQHYWPHFRDKVVLCNCDDPYESNFFKYFALRAYPDEIKLAAGERQRHIRPLCGKEYDFEFMEDDHITP